MPRYATPADVAGFLQRPEAELPPYVGDMLDDVGVLIDAKAPDASADAKRIVSRTRVAVALTNPSGAVQRQIGDYSERWDQAVAGQALALTSGDLSVLGARAEATSADAGFVGSLGMPVPAVRQGRRIPVTRRW